MSSKNNTNSFNFPNMIDVTRNTGAIATDAASIVSRVKLLMLTEPTELYMNTEYGLGLKRYMFQYNNDNVLAMIRDRLVEQLRLWEPCVIPEQTEIEPGLLFTEQNAGSAVSDPDHLKFTVIMHSKFGEKLTLEI